jgi:P-type Cu+ transporter
MDPTTAKVKDPVCGMMVDPATAAAKRRYDGRDFYFCSQGCARDFDSNPDDYGLEEA